MKLSQYIPFVAAALACLLPAASYSQSIGFELGGREIVKISSPARTALRRYLAGEYRHQCPAQAKNPPDICQQTKALYASSNLPSKDAHPLPQEVIGELGFIPPGTDYVQAGFVVYLIHLPRRIILDSVAVHETDTSSNIQW